MEKCAALIITRNPDVDLHSNQLNIIKSQFSKVLIVDNFSSEDLRSEMLENWSGCEVIKLEENVGIAKAQNIGLSKLLAQEFDYVVLFDQDSLPSGKFLSSMLEEARIVSSEDEDFAALGPVFFMPDSNIKIVPPVFLGPVSRRPKLEKHTRCKVDYLIASGCLVNMRVINEVGMMEEDLFIDYVDIEWCMRARSKGYSIYATDACSMVHTLGDKRVEFLGKSIPYYSDFRRYYQVRNFFFVLRMRHIPLGYKFRELVLQIFMRIPLSIIASKNRWKTLSTTFLAIQDGLKQRVN